MKFITILILFVLFKDFLLIKSPSDPFFTRFVLWQHNVPAGLPYVFGSKKWSVEFALFTLPPDATKLTENYKPHLLYKLTNGLKKTVSVPVLKVIARSSSYKRVLLSIKAEYDAVIRAITKKEEEVRAARHTLVASSLKPRSLGTCQSRASSLKERWEGTMNLQT